MTREPDRRDPAPDRKGPGVLPRFVGGLALGALEAAAIIGPGRALDDLVLPVFVVLMVGNGIAAAGPGGFAMLAGAWLGVPLPLLALAVAVGPTCHQTVFPIPGCPRAFYLALAGVALVAVPVIEIVPFLAARLIRWAVFDPTGEESERPVR